ncbi:probable plastid-lipid-associated protein 10, chloroplastic isoform X2 [Physcomitrium patens]|uniref:probable plastid-lipid-associated protein 10, chloroplastic isoform X2 n=1 Tax=Physcomitrium patens TaxID=3218 RepID=UPI000D17464C|nr:probable plastid-lipid-associated protein 10, chloroplastic isoform X2 [Physcomitrium patens]|eukprot:XP_024402920.1 probable plastid-lipid-associated protein 10, chloroplastic isoform X2 [Physcomitrella patens]
MQEVEKVKMDLLRAVMDTKRGAQVTTEQRAAVEDAMMGVEKYNAGTPLVLDQLHGTWLLQYTTASEIVSLIQAADQFPLLQVGQLYQCFDCQGRTDGGTVENIVRWSVSGLLQKNEGATFNVVAKFAMVGPRIIVIQKVEMYFRQGLVRLSPELESFIAPALLPRTFINFQVCCYGFL